MRCRVEFSDMTLRLGGDPMFQTLSKTGLFAILPSKM